VEKLKWKLWLIPLAALLAFGLLKGGDIWGQKKGEELPPVHVQTVSVEEVAKVKKENTLSLTGTLEAFSDATVSAKVPGRVSGVLVENGAAVAAGQPLVSLESTEFENQLAINRATLQKAEANLSSVRTNHVRFKELYAGGAVSKKEFEDLETALKVAEADVASAEAAVANAGDSLSNTTIASPLNGVVADRNVTPGQVVSPGVPLMTVKDLSSVYVLVNIEQKDLAVIKPGLRANVTVDTYGDRKFTGVVEIINPVAEESARVFKTKIRVDNPGRLLKPGMFAKVEIKTGEAEEVLAVPMNALVDKQGMYFVFVAEGDTARRRQVEIGRVIDQRVEIKSGLDPGQRVVVTNVNKLKDQDKINIAG